MDVVFILILLGFLLFFLRKYLSYRSYVKHLAESLEAKQSYLFEGESEPGSSKQMIRLTNRINLLIQENTKLQQEQASHLGQLEATLENMLEGVVVLDNNNHILLANNALRTSFSSWMGEEEIVGQRLEVLFSSSKLMSIIESIKAGGANEPKEIELIQASDRRWVRVSGVQARSDTANSEALIMLIFYEITHQKELEAVRREFVANVSHELRTPVTIIKGYVDTLTQDYDTMSESNKRLFINKLKKNADRMNDLLMDLLSLAKIESTDPGTSFERVGLNELIRQVLANFMDRLLEHKMDLDLQLTEKEIILQANRSKLEQVFENLFHNAAKYTPERSTLRVKTQEKEGSVRIIVEDNGGGIPEVDLPRIFERFYRVEKGRSRDKGGTGLGLSIVKRIIALHNGTVVAQHAKDGGLSIRITIPTV
jgi:two-component system, OmpR family, phosphate regulon sensor histidine kinase PhoR